MANDYAAPNAAGRRTTCLAPKIAYRKPDVFHGAYDREPGGDNDDAYATYRFLGRIKFELGQRAQDVLPVARAKFGPRAKVFQTARWWVCYAVD